MLSLRAGDEGAPVAAVQRATAAAGQAVPLDGVFDDRTEAGVRAFQHARGLRVDGIVGNRTLCALGLDWVTVDAPGFRSEIARLAEREWDRWHVDGHTRVETDPAMTGVLQNYYRTGVEREVDAADLRSAAYQATHPWSAVFISWVMRTSGAGERFLYSAAHQRYIARAKASRIEADAANPFWLFRLDELAPAVGDLLCKGRSGSGASFENIDDGPRRAHCDIVVSVDGDRLEAIGGNVGQTVGRKVLRTGERFDVSAPGQHEFFALIRVQG